MVEIEVGDTVLIPAEVIAVENGNPFGTYTVHMDYATDYFYYTDGITAIIPQPVATLQEEEETNE